MAHMNCTVGKGRAVMQGIAGMAFVLFQQFVIDIKFVPVPEHVRFPLWQAGTHGKIRFREVEGCIIIL